MGTAGSTSSSSNGQSLANLKGSARVGRGLAALILILVGVSPRNVIFGHSSSGGSADQCMSCRLDGRGQLVTNIGAAGYRGA
jgi:hypothetical protein